MRILSPNEATELENLLYKARYTQLTTTEQARLQWLVAKNTPFLGKISLAEAIELGMVLLGMYLVYQGLKK